MRMECASGDIGKRRHPRLSTDIPPLIAVPITRGAAAGPFEAVLFHNRPGETDQEKEQAPETSRSADPRKRGSRGFLKRNSFHRVRAASCFPLRKNTSRRWCSGPRHSEKALLFASRREGERRGLAASTAAGRCVECCCLPTQIVPTATQTVCRHRAPRAGDLIQAGRGGMDEVNLVTSTQYKSGWLRYSH